MHRAVHGSDGRVVDALNVPKEVGRLHDLACRLHVHADDALIAQVENVAAVLLYVRGVSAARACDLNGAQVAPNPAAAAAPRMTHQLVLRFDWDDVVAIVPHVLAELNTLLAQHIAAIAAFAVLVHQAPCWACVTHHFFQHDAYVVADDAEHAIEVHAVLQGVVGSVRQHVVLKSARGPIPCDQLRALQACMAGATTPSPGPATTAVGMKQT